MNRGENTAGCNRWDTGGRNSLSAKKIRINRRFLRRESFGGKTVSRLLLAMMAVFLLSACGPRTQAPLPVTVAKDEPLPGHGAVVVELVHAIGTNGSQIDEWTNVKVVSVVDESRGDKSQSYSLYRVVALGHDTALFAGSLPGGFYRVVHVEGERTFRPNTFARKTSKYTVPVPSDIAEFFVGAGKLTSLGVFLQSSVGSFSHVYQRDPSFDLPSLARRLRPDIRLLEIPSLIPESLGKKKRDEPASQIKRAFPTTPLHVANHTGLVGAQFGRVYYRDNQAGGHTADWKTISLESLQSVIDVLPVNTTRILALLAHGELADINPQTGKFTRHSLDVSGRAVKLALSGNRLHVVTEQYLPQGTIMRFYRSHVDALDSFSEWEQYGKELVFLVPAHDIDVVQDNFFFTDSPQGFDSPTLTRVSLPTGSLSTSPIPVRLIRNLGNGVLAGANGSWRSPEDMHVSTDGGSKWRKLEQIKVVGWPARDSKGAIVVPGLLSHRVGGDGSTVQILRLPAAGINGSHRWQAVTRFPMRCEHFMQSAFIDEKYVVLCGERVFQYEGPQVGWRKEALHEQQSSLP